MKRWIWLFTLALCLSFALVGCQQEEGDAGDAVEDAADDVGDALNDTMDNVGDAIEDAGDAVEDATDDAGDEVSDAGQRIKGLALA